MNLKFGLSFLRDWFNTSYISVIMCIGATKNVSGEKEKPKLPFISFEIANKIKNQYDIKIVIMKNVTLNLLC